MILAPVGVERSIKNAVEQAKELVEVLEREMTPEQPAEAQRLAREWKAKGK